MKNGPSRGGLLRTIVLARLAEEWSPAPEFEA